MGFTADYSRIYLRCANEWNKGLFYAKRDFPEVTENIKFVGASQKRSEEYFKFTWRGYLEYYYDLLWIDKAYEEFSVPFYELEILAIMKDWHMKKVKS